MNRRTFLVTGPTVGAAFALPVPAQSVEEDPILPLYREYMSARLEWHRLSMLDERRNDDTPEMLALSDREMAAYWAMLELTPTSTESIAALASVLWDTAGPCSPIGHPDYIERCAHPENRLIAAIWRGASGQGGLPPEVEGIIA